MPRSLSKNVKFANQHHVQSEQNVQQLVQSLRRHTRRQNVQSVQHLSAKIHVPHLRRIQILVQLIVVMLLRQRLPAQMMVVQTLSHVSAKSLIQLAQRRAVLHQIHAQLTSAQSVQYAIAAMIHQPTLVMISNHTQSLTQMQRSISVQMTTTFQQILQMQTLLMQLP